MLSCQFNLYIGSVKLGLGPKVTSDGRNGYGFNVVSNETSTNRGSSIDLSLLAIDGCCESRVTATLWRGGKEYTLLARLNQPISGFNANVNLQVENSYSNDLIVCSAQVRSSKFTVAHQFQVEGSGFHRVDLLIKGFKDFIIGLYEKKL